MFKVIVASVLLAINSCILAQTHSTDAAGNVIETHEHKVDFKEW